ncbi:PP2C family protein-serine/threonine phosphatase [Lignipirellula cremea]|uniref:Phosphoserine phosphatase RsbU n=1 Tax=Lignipirellula cremea TaxID=2528010 RepID=A0A518DKN9_9BACT|nr:PP2C family protein-serine/threonine phosphatase [Lignipirellula cremea]QDU92401.1 Phosphoserine phosphatase RsbU [Lignipirellula cremea]
MTGSLDTSPIPAPEQMRCMEVWGGNQGVEQYFQMPGLDVWLYSRPCDNAASGGDVYYLSSCVSGRISRLLLADVSGHGVAVSQCALGLRDLMRRYVNHVSQARFVAEMNEEFGRLNHDDNFATALVGTFFASTNSFQLSAAGHPQPLLFRQPSATWEVCEDAHDAATASRLRDIPLGVAGGVEYSQTKLSLAPGDMVLAYTDGLTETRVANDQLLGTAGLLKLVESLKVAPERLLFTLLSALREQSAATVGDDLTLLLARANGSRVPLRNNLLAPFRLLRRARDATRFR